MARVAPVNLPTDLLRTFVTVIDLGGYTRAGDALSRTQPAISLQMRRLEALVDTKLLYYDRRTLKLTDAGVALCAYARQILRLNDEAVARLGARRTANTVRVGLPTDYALVFLQDGLTRFAAQHDGLELEIRCDLSRHLREQLAAGELDLAVALYERDGEGEAAARAWQERPLWAASRVLDVRGLDPVPLVVHPEGCEYRRRMVAALERHGRAWRTAYTSPGIAELQQAVADGLGVSALTRKTLSSAMTVLDENDGFPSLPALNIGLFRARSPLPAAAGALMACLEQLLDDAGGADGPDRGHPSRLWDHYEDKFSHGGAQR